MLLMFLVLAGVVALDQVSKTVVAARLREGAIAVGTVGGVRLRLVVNRGHPWTSIRGVVGSAIVWAVLVAVAAGMTAVVDVTWVSAALGSSLGGAMGNLIDGIGRRAVIDFIDLRVWPVFNLADAAIVAGAMIAACGALRLL
jgi:signal peptidase II